MPHIDTWEDILLYRRYTGVVTGREVVEANYCMYGAPEFDNLRTLICDYINIEEIELDIDKFENETVKLVHLSMAAAKTNPHVKIGIVANDKTVQALTALYCAELTTESWPVKLFTDLDTAIAWAQ